MPRNGSGVYSPPAANYPAVSGTLIESADRNAIDADIAAAITDSIAVNGESVVTNNIPFGGNKLTGVGNATARTDAATLATIQDGTGVYVATVGGTADVITLTPSPAITAYVAGQLFSFIASGANTTNVTVTVSGLGAKAITKNGSTALVGGDIPSGFLVTVRYDGTRFQLVGAKDVFTGGTLTSLLTQAAGADIASAATLDLTAATGNTLTVTGTTTTTAITMNAGQQMELIAAGAWPLTYHATNCNINGGASYTCSAGDRLKVTKAADGVVRVNVIKQDGTAISGSVKQIQPITASVGASELTVTLNPTTLDFRSATLGSGTVNTRTISSAISLVISSGSTLGTVNAVASRIAVLAIDNAGTVELAAVNLAGGTNLDETGVISTTAEGGAGGADSATVIYSTTARTNVPYRVVGYVESTQATAGTWATAPSTIQGYGGQALAALSSLGYGQTWQSVTRTAGTTYYNTTGKPIQLSINAGGGLTSTFSLTIAGVVAFSGTNPANGSISYGTFVIPNGASYSFTNTANTPVCTELR